MKLLSQRTGALFLTLCLFLTFWMTGCNCRPQKLEPLPEKLSTSEQTEVPEETPESPSEPEEPEEPEKPEESKKPEKPEKPVVVTDPIQQSELPAFPDTVSLQCGQAFAYNCNTGEVVGIKGTGERLYPASTTKILTILTALEYLPLDQHIMAGSELNRLAADASVAYVFGGVTLTAEQMIEGMLLPSGNDAALALAAAAGKAYTGDANLPGEDAVDACCEAMNTYAASIGMANSHFTNPDGYMDENHYTTVEDMARLAAVAANNEVIMKYCGLTYDKVTFVSGEEQEWSNTNSMLYEGGEWYNPYVTGMKTGSFTGSYCLLATLEHEDQKYVVGVFTGADNAARYGDVNTISDWLFGG